MARRRLVMGGRGGGGGEGRRRRKRVARDRRQILVIRTEPAHRCMQHARCYSVCDQWLHADRDRSSTSAVSWEPRGSHWGS